nr:PREDICTED: uncharacterized protein LOC100141755 isoform X2 [Tribolium castaneum]XP_015837851.1 PREDICTED: uncharacterized protein LOC100141755 isoform X2 [Tribolium castaneum]|eukprot:XP_008200535.1 PREDICTED: uncharacterized protein LOC100141755 isoform X2 [Tribolium castaneum]
MIGAMPAVAVRHERRKGQEKRSKRPSQLYIGGHWLPPTSPSPTPSPNGPHDDGTDRLPELYICGKVSALQLVVGSILLGAIVLIVGLVQLVPNAADADHRYIFIGAGGILLFLGFVMAGVRCFCIHCHRGARIVMEDVPPTLDAVNSIDVLVQRRDTQVTSPSELDALIGHSSQGTDKENTSSDT